MLKLPKGLKKKKKGKKSKKDQELFTEEELEQYRREHQNQSVSANSTVPSDSEDQSGAGEKSENDEEWSKFAALTSGIDSVLKKTQGDLDRIKSTSFFQKVPTRVEQETREREERRRREQEEQARASEEAKAEEESRTAEELINAVVELSESESNSEAEEDDIFDTGYIDAIASGELPIAYVPESPVLETYEGEDPFDTSYADKVIKGPEVSKRGKKLVSIGSAVGVLTGRVECAGTGLARGSRQRRGQQNLLLESFDDGEKQQQQGQDDENVATSSTAAAKEVLAPAEEELKSFSLLDDSTDCPDDAPVDLSVSLHLTLQKQYQEENSKAKQQETATCPTNPPALDLDEFDDFKNLESSAVGRCDFEQLIEETNGTTKANAPSSALNQLINDLNDFEEPEADDPFDTGFVEKVLPATAVEDDEFNPRAEESGEVEDFEFDSLAREAAQGHQVKTPDLFSDRGHDQPAQTAGTLGVTKDLLSGSSPDLAAIPQLTPFECADSCVLDKAATSSSVVVDPFDTSSVEFIVAPGKTELKYLEEEFLTDQQVGGSVNHSLSDSDFNPRAESEGGDSTGVQQQEESYWPEEDFQSIAQRKSSLSLQINGVALGAAAATNRSKSVVFAVPTPDLLKIDTEHPITKKPLTPYYNRETAPTDADADPFDTSFVPSVAPTQLELHLLDQELNSVTLKHSLSDPEFDPRADTATGTVPQESTQSPRSDLLAVSEENQDLHKVLTPAHLEGVADDSDPFDTSIAVNLQPGRAELKLLEDELIPPQPTNDSLVSDILSEGAHEASSVFVKVLTPQASSTSLDLVGEQEELDPFDTSFVSNLGPGKAEIKLLESELIDQ